MLAQGHRKAKHGAYDGILLTHKVTYKKPRKSLFYSSNLISAINCENMWNKLTKPDYTSNKRLLMG